MAVVFCPAQTQLQFLDDKQIRWSSSPVLKKKKSSFLQHKHLDIIMHACLLTWPTLFPYTCLSQQNLQRSQLVNVRQTLRLYWQPFIDFAGIGDAVFIWYTLFFSVLAPVFCFVLHLSLHLCLPSSHSFSL